MSPGAIVVEQEPSERDRFELSEDLLQSLAPYTKVDTSLINLKETLQSYYVISTAEKIHRNGYKRIALQFPDEYLPSAPVVCAALSALLGDDVLIFVLGDTSYGACCADEVAAQHLDADAIVHYGDACLSPTRSLPVLYVFAGHPLAASEQSTEELQKAIREVLIKSPDSSRIVLLYDVELTHAMLSARPILKTEFPELNIEMSTPQCGDLCDFILSQRQKPPSGTPSNSNLQQEDKNDMIEVGGLEFPASGVPLEDTTILWICQQRESDELPLSLRNTALQLANGLTGSCRGLYRYDANGTLSAVEGWRHFRLRAREASLFRNAQRVGVVAGTLAVAGVTEAIQKIVQMIEDAGKRAYVLLVGKISAVKLLNFEEMDAFVIVACPLRTLLSSKELPVPVVSPLEAETVLNGTDELYSKPYSTDFRQMQHGEIEPITNNDGEELGLTKRGEWSVTVGEEGGAASFYKERAWKGLQRNKGGRDEDTAVEELSTNIVQGSSGIAQRYSRE